MSNLTRRFLFDIRPRHRETITSYTRRLLAANFETEDHQHQLVRELTRSQKPAEQVAAWLKVLGLKTKRAVLHFSPDEHGWVRHPDGSSCENCAAHLSTRWMCRLCAHGADIEQSPHFDDIVCIRHRRWVGLTTAPARQHAVSEQHVRAALKFKRLRRQGRIDVHLYRALERAVTLTLPLEQRTNPSAAFPAVIALASAVTEVRFARAFFNPALTYKQAHAHLSAAVERVLGAPQQDVTRALWLYARPTFWALRQSALTGEPFTAAWAHDLYVHPSITADSSREHRTQPFEDYLDVTGDTVVSAAQYGRQRTAPRGQPILPRRTIGDGLTLVICNAGHQTEASPEFISKLDAGTPTSCPVCRHRVIVAGVNDLATTHPDAAAEFDAELNGVTAQEVGASSSTKYHWRCHKDHSYLSTPSNRAHAGTGCPICLNRKVVFGVNDLTTTHPELVAEWDPAWLGRIPPATCHAGSKRWAHWVCPAGHSYIARINERVAGRSCYECTDERVRVTEQHLALTHPELAAEWHTTMNGRLLPQHRTAGSRDEVYWLCSQGHYYKERIERRVRGYKCKVCSHRGGVVTGINDLTTTHAQLITEWHPYMNLPADPSRLFAGTEPRWWLCSNKHKTKQSVPNRLKSKGCTDCAPEDRVLVRR